MAIPQGNFVALQALKPKEYKIGDLYLQMTDYLIKKGEAEKAAKIKAAEEEDKYWDDVSKKYKIDYFSTIDKLTDDSRRLFQEAYDLNSYHTSILQDRNASRQQKEESQKILNNLQRDFLSYSTTLKDPKFIEGYQKRKEAIDKREYFDKDPDLAVNMAFEAGISQWGFAPDGSLKVYTPDRFGDDTVRPKSLGEIVQAFTTLPTPDLVNGKNGFLQTIYDAGADLKKKWQTDTGITKQTFEQYSKEKGQDWLNTFIGTEYDPNRHGTKSKEWQLAVSLGLKDLNENNFGEFRNKVEEILTIKAPNVQLTDVARPTTVNVRTGGGGSGDDSENEPIIADNVIELIPSTTGQKTNYLQTGVMIRGSKDTGKTDRFGNAIKQPVWIKAYWGGGKGNEKAYYAIMLPTKSGGFKGKPLSSKYDKQGFQAARKYLTDKEVEKLAKKQSEFFSNPQNRQFGRLITEQLPEDYNQVDFSPYFNTSSNQSKPQIKTTSRK